MARTFNPYNRLNKEFERYCKANDIDMDSVAFDGDVDNDKYHSWRCYYENTRFLVVFEKNTKKCYTEPF